jgi:hypothetical protein
MIVLWHMSVHNALESFESHSTSILKKCQSVADDVNRRRSGNVYISDDVFAVFNLYGLYSSPVLFICTNTLTAHLA